MNKKIALGLIMLFSVLLVNSVLAANSYVSLTKKNPSTWAEIKGQGSGKITFYRGIYKESGETNLFLVAMHFSTVVRDTVSVTATKLNPNTAYTLIYYGFESHNDEWPYATCIYSGTANKVGTFMGTAKFDWRQFLDDGKNQKFWIVPSTDVNCNTHALITWNPSQWLFEKDGSYL